MTVTRRGFFGFLAALPFVPKVWAAVESVSPAPTEFSVQMLTGDLRHDSEILKGTRWVKTSAASEVIRAADLNAEFDKMMRSL